jgi:hypothetical protein
MNFADIKMTTEHLGVTTPKNWGALAKANSYKVTIYHNGKQFTTHYHTGMGHKVNEFTIKDIMYCLLLDASSAENTLIDFAEEFGYDCNDEETKQIYRACVTTRKALDRLFDKSELQSMREQLENY